MKKTFTPEDIPSIIELLRGPNGENRVREAYGWRILFDPEFLIPAIKTERDLWLCEYLVKKLEWAEVFSRPGYGQVSISCTPEYVGRLPLRKDVEIRTWTIQ